MISKQCILQVGESADVPRLGIAISFAFQNDAICRKP